MTTPKAGTWQAILSEFAPDLFQKVAGFQETVLVEGALSVKTKTLMMMLCWHTLMEWPKLPNEPVS